MPVKVTRRQFRLASKSESKSCSLVTIVATILLVMWLSFIIYCWKSGLIGFHHLPATSSTESNPSSGSEIIVGKSSSLAVAPVPVPLLRKPINEEEDIHIIFSTDCNPYQVKHQRYWLFNLPPSPHTYCCRIGNRCWFSTPPCWQDKKVVNSQSVQSKDKKHPSNLIIILLFTPRPDYPYRLWL